MLCRVWWTALAGILAGAAVLSADPAPAQEVGVAAAVNPQAQGTPPDRPARTLTVGLDVFKNERVVTGPEGKTQMVFLDGSALSIGPNSEVVLDEFVYDPATETGKLAMTATKGVFRLVGGKVSKSEPVVLKTPTATLGIRGGIAIVSSSAITFLYGNKLTVTGTGPGNAGQTVELRRGGTTLPLGANGSFGPLQPVDASGLGAVLGSFEGNAGRTGGATEVPTDTRVAGTGFGQIGSSLSPQVAAGDPPPPPAPSGSQQADQLTSSGAQLATQNQVAENGNPNTMISSPVVVPMPVGNLSGRYKSTPGSGFLAGTAGDGDPSFDRPFTGGAFLGNLFMASPGGDGFSAPVNAAGGFLSYTSDQATSPFGPIQGTSFTTPNRDFVFFESTETSFSNERSFLFAGTPTPVSAIPASGFGAYDIRGDFVAGSAIPFIPSPAGGNLTASVSPAFIGFDPMTGMRPFLQGSIAITGQGASQSSAISVLIGNAGISGALNLTGEMRGSSSVNGGPASFFTGPIGFAADPNGNGVFGTSGPNNFVLQSPGGVQQSDGSYATSAFFPNNVAMSGSASGVGANRTAGTFTGVANGAILSTIPGTTSRSVGLIGDSSSSATFTFSPQSNTLSGSFNLFSNDLGNAYVFNFGDAAPGDGRSAFIDDQRFAARESVQASQLLTDGPSFDLPGVKIYVVSGNLAQVSSLLPSGTTYCTCSFMSWGFWGVDFADNPNGTGNLQRIHLGQWVAGDMADAPSIAALTGTALFNGHAIADVINNGQTYKAGGSFNMSYNFTTQQGNVQIGSLDGITYSGPVNSAGVGFENQLFGSIAGTGGGSIGAVTGSANLAFYRNGAAHPAAGVAGSFSAQNTNAGYRTVGIVIGQQ